MTESSPTLRRYTLPWGLGVNSQGQWALNSAYPLSPRRDGTINMPVEDRPDGTYVVVSEKEWNARLENADFTDQSDWYDRPIAGVQVGDAVLTSATETLMQQVENHTLAGAARHRGQIGYTLPWALGKVGRNRYAVNGSYPFVKECGGTLDLPVRSDIDGLHVMPTPEQLDEINSQSTVGSAWHNLKVHLDSSLTTHFVTKQHRILTALHLI